MLAERLARGFYFQYMETVTTYEQLLTTHGNHYSIPYDELLQTIEWKAKRIRVISKDGYKCCNCKMTETIYENKPPYHFYLDGEDEYETIYNEDGTPIEEKWKIRLVPAPRAVIFHVHHTYYIFDSAPWQYPDEALITLCSQCHFELHKTTVIQWVDADHVLRNLTPCPRCNGAGGFPEYSHVQNGKCFYCKGTMYKEFMK